MPQDSPESQRYRLASLTDKRALSKLGIIGLVVLIIVMCFAYAGGWLWADRLSQAKVIDGFELANGGVHSGFRRNHAKGVCVTGSFESNGAGARLSRATVLSPGSFAVAGRISLAGGHPGAADEPTDVRAMGLRILPPTGEEWRTAMIDLPVFVVRDPESFYEQLLATKPDPATGKPDPAKVAAFSNAHPEFAAAMKVVKSNPFSSGFANANYNSLIAFRFVNAAGVVTPVRWSMVATDPFAPEAADQAKGPDKNYLFDDLIARLARGPVQWHLVVTIAKPGDATDDATIPWPADREHVDVGTLTLDRAETEAPGNCRDINFDPLALPAGIESSDDPLLSLRSAGYSESFTRREGEKKTPSAVQVPVTGKGP
ncbi:MAG TPA: catalase family peroxidase [Pseudolabrys sp.]|nr:catalase family peroxidase [Pseudolabrys sp.]